MNILIAVTVLSKSNGGVCTHVIDLCRELIKRNHNVCLLTDNEDNDYLNQIKEIKEADYSGEFSFYPMELHDVPVKKYFKTASQIKKIVKKHKIDIIHVHGQALCVIAELVKLRTFGKVPFVWTNHIDAIHRPEQFRKILKTFKFPIISVSTDLKEMMVNDYGVSEKRVFVVCNGTNVEKYVPFSETERKELRENRHWDGKYVIALLARISDVKGHQYLLEAVNKIQRENGIDDIKVVFAGQLYDDYKGYLLGLEKYAVENNIDLEFLGFQNPRDVFGLSDLSVLPSVFEGFPLTVLESLAMNCPVIRSDTPGYKDTSSINLVFPKRDVQKFSEHLLYAYTHKEEMKQMAIKGRQIVLERFSLDNQIEDTLKVYQSIL